MRPKVSVYITCHNYGNYVVQAIQSVYDQIFSDWELLIIDDGSTDDSREKIESATVEKHDEVRLFFNDRPRGLPFCANLAISEAHGEYLIRLDADDWFDESALLTMSEFLEKNTDKALVYPNYTYVDANGFHLGVENRKKIGTEAKVLDLPAHGACTMVRKRVLKAIGGYSTQYNAQDGHEMWLNVIDRYEVANVTTPLFYYRQHANSLTKDNSKVLTARQKIKRGARKKENKGVGIKVVGVIPAKNTYKETPNICLEPIAGRPLIDYTLDAALGSELLDEVLVATDDDAVMDHCRSHESLIVYRRPMSLSQSHVKQLEVISDAVEYLEEDEKIFPDAIVLLNVHCPLKLPSDIDEAVDTLVLYGVDSVVSIYEDQELHFRHGHRGIEPLNESALNQVYLERESLFVDNGAIKAIWRDIVSGPNLFGRTYGHVAMPMERSIIYRDSYTKWLLEERLNYLKTVGATQSTVTDDGPK